MSVAYYLSPLLAYPLLFFGFNKTWLVVKKILHGDNEKEREKSFTDSVAKVSNYPNFRFED